jgi:hypothetical protein
MEKQASQQQQHADPMEGVTSVESMGPKAVAPAFSLSSGGADAPPSDGSGSGGAGIKRVGKEGMSMELLGKAGGELSYAFLSKYGNKLIAEHNPIPEVAILIGDILMHFFGPAITTAEGAMQRLAEATLSILAPAPSSPASPSSSTASQHPSANS